MQNFRNYHKQASLLLLLFFSTLLSNAQTFLTTQIISTSPPTFTNPLGVVIPSGNTVSIISNAIVQFNFNLTIDSGVF